MVLQASVSQMGRSSLDSPVGWFAMVASIRAELSWGGVPTTQQTGLLDLILDGDGTMAKAPSDDFAMRVVLGNCIGLSCKSSFDKSCLGAWLRRAPPRGAERCSQGGTADGPVPGGLAGGGVRQRSGDEGSETSVSAADSDWRACFFNVLRQCPPKSFLQ